jgi:hypothetical protein
MKPIKSAAIFLFCFGSMANSQIVLEKVYNFADICPSCTTKVRAFNTESETFYYFTANESINFYNLDHSLYKQINTKSENESFLEVYLPSDKLFNTDNTIEFVALRAKGDIYSFILMNENGDSITTLGDNNCEGYRFYYEYNLIQYVKTIDNKSKLIVNSAEHLCDSVFVYSLPGTLTKTQENLLRSQNMTMFPNPSSDFATIKTNLTSLDGTLQISDINGRNIKNISIEPGIKEKTIDISDFKPGVYIYKSGNQSGKFIVN